MLKNPNCIICNVKFENMEHLNSHMQKRHQESDNDRMNRLTLTIQTSLDTNEMAEFSCELCERAFPNQVQMSNHKLFLHTVKTDKMKCDYCGIICDGLKNMCKHISSKHSELFPK